MFSHRLGDFSSIDKNYNVFMYKHKTIVEEYGAKNLTKNVGISAFYIWEPVEQQ